MDVWNTSYNQDEWMDGNKHCMRDVQYGCMEYLIYMMDGWIK